MKTLIIACEDKLSSLKRRAIDQGREPICYSWPLKALDNLPEIAPQEIIFDEESFGRQWKVLAGYLLTTIASNSHPRFLLLLNEPLSKDDTDKAYALNVIPCNTIDELFNNSEEAAPTVESLLTKAVPAAPTSKKSQDPSDKTKGEIEKSNTKGDSLFSVLTLLDGVEVSSLFTVDNLLTVIKNALSYPLPTVSTLLPIEGAASLNKSDKKTTTPTTPIATATYTLPTVASLLTNMSSDSLFSVETLLNGPSVSDALSSVVSLLATYKPLDLEAGRLWTVKNLLPSNSNILAEAALFTVANLLSENKSLPDAPLPTVTTLLETFQSIISQSITKADDHNKEIIAGALFTVANLFEKLPRNVLFTVSNLFDECIKGDVPLNTVIDLFDKIAKDNKIDFNLRSVASLFRGTHYGSLLKKIILDYI